MQETRVLQPELISDQVISAIPEQETTHIPSRSELPPNRQNALPAISIAGHTYAETPSGNMVIINGKVSREKQHFGNDLVLEEITADDVTLNHHGTVFRMGIFE